MVEVGQAAPEFTLPDQEGNEVSLSDFRGQRVVVYFYPKADTPGCTTQACGIRDHAADYDAADAVVLGISPDTVKDVKTFADKFDLRFHLLADADHAVAEKYGVWQEKARYGRKYMGIVRTTYLIDAEGKVAKRWDKVNVTGHVDEVLAAVKSL